MSNLIGSAHLGSLPPAETLSTLLIAFRSSTMLASDSGATVAAAGRAGSGVLFQYLNHESYVEGESVEGAAVVGLALPLLRLLVVLRLVYPWAVALVLLLVPLVLAGALPSTEWRRRFLRPT